MKLEFIRSVIFRPHPKKAERVNAKIGSVHEVDQSVADWLMDRDMAVPASRNAELTDGPEPAPPVEQKGQQSASATAPAAPAPQPAQPAPQAPRVRSAARPPTSRVRQAGPMAVRPVEAPVQEGGGLADKLNQ